MPTRDELKQMQSLPLDVKILKTKARIKEWVDYYGEDNVYISFSGGKDSTVLLDIARQEYPNMKAVFVNTGLEYPEIQSFVRTFDNVEILRPTMRFDEVITKYGYPFISKDVAGCISAAHNFMLKNGISRGGYDNISHWSFRRLTGQRYDWFGQNKSVDGTWGFP